jgi:hypothetical protein
MLTHGRAGREEARMPALYATVRGAQPARQVFGAFPDCYAALSPEKQMFGTTHLEAPGSR